MKILVHADDFGISPEQSAQILACFTHGALNSTSLMMTSPHIQTCIDMIPADCILDPTLETHAATEMSSPSQKRLMLGCHLNLVEGPSLCGHELLPHLTDERGYFSQSFAGLLKLSFQREEAIHTELTREITAQLRAFVDVFPFSREALRVDSHQHTHMIPLVFRVLNEVIQREQMKLWYMRTPVEFILPYLHADALRSQTRIPVINTVKVALLNSLWRLNSAQARASHIPRTPFMGVMLSGHMEKTRLEIFGPALIANAQKYASQRDFPHATSDEAQIELLFHPGGISDVTSEALDPEKPDFTAFYTSAMRAEEARYLKDPEFWELKKRPHGA